MSFHLPTPTSSCRSCWPRCPGPGCAWGAVGALCGWPRCGRAGTRGCCLGVGTSTSTSTAASSNYACHTKQRFVDGGSFCAGGREPATPQTFSLFGLLGTTLPSTPRWPRGALSGGRGRRVRPVMLLCRRRALGLCGGRDIVHVSSQHCVSTCCPIIGHHGNVGTHGCMLCSRSRRAGEQEREHVHKCQVAASACFQS